MTIQKFEATPTGGEAFDVHSVRDEKSKEAWKEYEAKPEYKKFNKHDMIESMQAHPKPDSQS